MSESRGSQRMRENGYLRVEVWFEEAQLVRVREAARLEGCSVAEYVRRAAAWAAVDDLRK